MIDKFDKWFVPEWRSFWRWYSSWMHLIGTTIGGVLIVQPTMPAEVQAVIPAKWLALGLMIWGIGGVIARVVKQGAP